MASRADFPGLHQDVNGQPLIYFDNAATTQKPLSVIEAVDHHYRLDNANVHRGVHVLSSRATHAFEKTRSLIAEFINAKYLHEVIFTRGTTEAINLVAYCYGLPFLKKGDEILITTMEHHANIVPWQMVCEKTGAILKVVPLVADADSGELDRDAFSALLSKHTKIVSFSHISNVLGTINPVAELISEVREKTSAIVVIDGAQAIAHLPVDVQALDCDFYAFSGHKMYGPSGVGILYGKTALLERMPPFQFGGEMIKTVSFEHTEYNGLPFKFEAGTPNIEGVIGLGAAVEYLKKADVKKLAAQEKELLSYATDRIKNISDIRLSGTSKNKAAMITFVIKGIPAQDISTLLDMSGIAIRVGHHCAMPLHESLGLNSSARASFAFYNTKEEIDQFIIALNKALKVLHA